MFHYLVWTNDTDGRAEKQYWEDYVAVNRQFAEVIASQYRAGDISKFLGKKAGFHFDNVLLTIVSILIVFLNDYHLLLVPEMLREMIPDAPIGLFLHATFPSSEIFRCLSSNYSIITYHKRGLN